MEEKEVLKDLPSEEEQQGIYDYYSDVEEIDTSVYQEMLASNPSWANYTQEDEKVEDKNIKYKNIKDKTAERR